MSYFNKWNDRAILPAEIQRLKVIQAAQNTPPDGYFGEHTLTMMYLTYNPKDTPIAFSSYNANIIVGKSFLPIHSANKTGVRSYANSISGTFQYRNVTASMFCVNGEWIKKSSTHYWLQAPETVLYITKSGEVKSQRCIQSSEIKDDVLSAVGGMGLHNWNPDLEWFKRGVWKDGKTYDYSDVLRRTGHTCLGWNGEYFYAVYMIGTGADCRRMMMDNLKCIYAIMLDGGHLAAINTPRATKNTVQIQNNIVQLV